MKLGFLGAGLIANHHATGIKGLITSELLDVSLSGVYDPDLGRVREFVKRFGVEHVFASDKELIESDSVDAIFVTTWTGEHFQLVEQIASVGKPVFCEKPLAMNLADARQMLGKVEQHGVPNQIGLVLRTIPSYGFTRDLIKDPGMGRLMAVNFRDDQYFPIQGVYRSDWRKDSNLAGSGTFLEHSIHDVDLIHWMFGEFTKVRAVTRNFAGYPHIEDLAIVDGELKQGGQVSFMSVWHNVLSRESNRHLEIFFENGRVVVEDDVFGPVTLEQGNRPMKVFDQAEIGAHYVKANPEVFEIGPAVKSPTALEDYRFLKSLIDGRRPEPDFSVGLAAHEVVEAAYRSAVDDCSIELPLV